MPVYLIAALVILVLFSVIYFFMFYQKHMLGDNAPELKLDIRVLDKQSVPVPNPQQHEDEEEYWIYVEPLAGGKAREFQVGVHYYHALQPGDTGSLTYRGNKFMHFAKTRQ